ncbi:hypothetical protein B0H11DRAFT_2012079, partial [Mycena galericulata]
MAAAETFDLVIQESALTVTLRMDATINVTSDSRVACSPSAREKSWDCGLVRAAMWSFLSGIREPKHTAKVTHDPYFSPAPIVTRRYRGVIASGFRSRRCKLHIKPQRRNFVMAASCRIPVTFMKFSPEEWMALLRPRRSTGSPIMRELALGIQKPDSSHTRSA